MSQVDFHSSLASISGIKLIIMRVEKLKVVEMESVFIFLQIAVLSLKRDAQRYIWMAFRIPNTLQY